MIEELAAIKSDIVQILYSAAVVVLANTILYIGMGGIPHRWRNAYILGSAVVVCVAIALGTYIIASRGTS